MSTKYDFAPQWLDFLGVEIYNNDERILEYNGKPTYDISPLDTRIRVGEDLGEDDEEEYTTLSYPDLLNLGFIVFSESNPDLFWKTRQQCFYRIRRKTRTIFGIAYESYRHIASRTSMNIQHDPTNRRIRLIGESVLADKRLPISSGIGSWIVYDEDAPHVIKKRKRTSLSKEDYRARIKSKMFGKAIPQNEQFIPIDEVPLILSDEKYFVCMKKTNECQRILINGASGYGKTVCANAIAGRIFYKYEDRLGWIIDPLGQLYDISLPQDYSEFNKINELINDIPKPIPALQLFLAQKPNEEIYKRDSSLVLVLDFIEFLRKMQFYCFGIKDWDLGGPRRYLMKHSNAMENVKTGREIKKIMEEKIPAWKKDKQMQNMLYKWETAFDGIFRDKFTSNVWREEQKATSSLEVKFPDGKTMKGHPFIMAMMAGLVPVINMAGVKDQMWFRNYLADIIQKVVKHQVATPEKERKRLWIVADELNEIYEVSSGKKKDKAAMAIEGLYRQGRFNRIGFIGNTQSLEKVNPEMYKNATHIMCVYMRTPKERKIIGDTFGVEKEVYDKIRDLKKQEIMVFSKEPFIIYDRWGKRKVITDRKWFKGRILPPVSYSKAPK